MSTTLPPTLAVHRLTLYNTPRLDDEEVMAVYAARLPVLERILADLAAERPRSRAQHHLIVGQRGMGKTLLLARLAAGVRTGPLAARFVPLVLAEEQYAVDRLSKFWMNCLDSLADACERMGSVTESEDIDRTVQRLESRLPAMAKQDETLAREALDAFLTTAAATGRRPLLLVDNLQLVFERLSQPEQHALREVLTRPGGPILVGASPVPPPESQDYRAAFYDQFKVHYLRPLELEEMRSLLLHLAEVSGRDDVRTRVLQQPERLAVLRQLTGGNPRTTVTLFFLYTEDDSPDVFGDLENLLDRVTPLYKARFEELAPQQQVVAGAIANHWDPVTSRILCEATGLGPNQVSPQLDRLEKTGLIEKVDLFGESRTGFQLAERFFNVWLLMRSGSRRKRREVEFLTRFLQTFYESADRLPLTHSQPGEPGLGSDPGMAPDDPALQEVLVAAYDANWGIARKRLAAILEPTPNGPRWPTVEDWMRAGAVLLHLNYGAALLVFLEERGEHLRLRPWFEAVRAAESGDRRLLQNIAVEIRPTAEALYDDMEQRLAALPAVTSRRSAAMPRSGRAKRKV